MKHAYAPALLVLVLWLGFQQRLSAQTSDAVFAQIETAIKAGDAQALSQFFFDTVEITLLDQDQDYARTQAQFVVKEFFTNYPVRTFSLMHKGASGDTFYAIGSYVSSRGAFDTNIFLKRHNGKFMIETIRFERDK